MCAQCLATTATRIYHNLDHLMSMFDFLRFATRAGAVPQDPAAVDWAVWFHDIIHDPRRCGVGVGVVLGCGCGCVCGCGGRGRGHVLT